MQLLAVLNQYPTDQVENGLRIRAGGLLSDETREILAELLIPSLHDLGPQQVGEIVVTSGVCTVARSSSRRPPANATRATRSVSRWLKLSGFHQQPCGDGK